VYVADWGNHRIVRFIPGSTLELVAGSLPKGYEDGIGESAKFRRPSGLAFAQDGSLFVSDATNGYIRSIDPENRTSTVAGDGPPRVEPIVGKLGDLSLNMPHGLDTLQNGSVLIADLGSNRILLFDGSTLIKVSGGSQGFADGPLDSAKFYYPTDVSFSDTGYVYVADTGNNEIRKLILDPVLLEAAPGT
jgi:DNA-binding beta-propeller fold protein YncE